MGAELSVRCGYEVVFFGFGEFTITHPHILFAYTTGNIQLTPPLLAMASLTCVQDAGVRSHGNGDGIHTTSQARAEQVLCHFPNARDDTKGSLHTPRYTHTNTMDSLSISNPPSPLSPRKTKLRRALALEDMLAHMTLTDAEDQAGDQDIKVTTTSYELLTWDMCDDVAVSCPPTGAKSTEKLRVRAATLTSPSAARKLDLEEKIEAALQGHDSRAFVRPAQAGFLLKKTLRGA